MGPTRPIPATTQACMIPELVSLIIGFLEGDGAALAACMRVNSTWSQTAGPILWQKCGAMWRKRARREEWVRPGPWTLPPEMQLFANLSKTPGRLQHYANFVRVLCFDLEDLDGDPHERDTMDDSLDEARFHTIFRNITFPRLISIIFRGSEYSHIHNRTSMLLQYLQSNLLSFEGFGRRNIEGFCRRSIGANLSDEFFSTLKSRCPSLISLKIALNIENPDSTELVSRKAFADFLEGMQSLVDLKLRHGFDKVMSSEALAHIARYESLSTLSLPDIPENWAVELDRRCGSAHKLFPSIRCFKAGLSDTSLRLLLQHLPNIGRLVVRPFEHAKQSLCIIAKAKLTALFSLSLRFDVNSIVYGTDLSLLAEYAKKLEYLDIPPAEKSWDYADRVIYPHASGITDAVIDGLARGLPDLRMLDLNARNTSLTEASLISLATYCKLLERLSLSVDAPLERLARNDHSGLFPELKTLILRQPDSDRPPHNNLRQTAESLCQMMPNLDRVGLVDIEGDYPWGGSDPQMAQAIVEFLSARHQ